MARGDRLRSLAAKVFLKKRVYSPLQFIKSQHFGATKKGKHTGQKFNLGPLPHPRLSLALRKGKRIDPYTQISTFLCMKRTDIVFDEKLVGKGMELTGIRIPKALVDCALRELVPRKEQKGILKLKGKVSWEGDLDKLRRNRF